MAISIDFSAHEFSGRGALTYPVNFPVTGAEDVRVAVKPAGTEEFITLFPGDYTVTPDEGGNLHVLTDTPYPTGTVVRIFRYLQVQQPFEFPEGGPFAARSVERALDRLLMLIQQVRLEAGLEGAAISLPGGPAMVVADAAERGATAPSFPGQLLVQLSPAPAGAWIGVSVAAGAWLPLDRPAAVAFASRGAMLSAAPQYVGQIAWPAGSHLQYRGTGLGTGDANWAPNTGTCVVSDWVETPWTGQEAMTVGEKRWAGSSGLFRVLHDLYYGYINGTLYAVAGTAGFGRLRLKVSIRKLDAAPADITPLYLEFDAGTLGTMFPRGYEAVAGPTDSMMVEITGIGEDVELNLIQGSTTVAPGAFMGPYFTTGVRVNRPGGYGWPAENWHVVALKGGADTGKVIMSHPARYTSSDVTGRAEGAIFARGIFFSSAQPPSAVVVPIDAVSAALIRVGDAITGPAVEPGAVVEHVDTASNNMTMSRPLLGTASYVTVTSPDRPPIVHFKDITGSTGNTVITVPDTSRIRVGDSVLGLNVPALARVTAKTSTTITLSAGLSGSITELTVTHPRRTVATAAVGAGNLIMNAGDVPIGCKISGPGILPDTYVQNFFSTQVSMTLPLTLAMTAAPVTFSRDELEIPSVSFDAGATMLTLTGPASATAVEDGYLVEGPQFLPATFGYPSGNYIYLSRPTLAAGASVSVRLRRPTQWKGLSVGVFGSARVAGEA